MAPLVPHVIIAGGGLAGMAAAEALTRGGFRVTLFESRPFLGGRASSFPLNSSAENSESIDNCQHILLRCCVNLLDFYRRLGSDSMVRFHREFFFLEPGGRLSILKGGALPAPLHLAGSFARLPFLSPRAKLSIARAMLAVRLEWGRRRDLDEISMFDWLREKQQPDDAVARFWRPILVSAVNEELDVAAARHGLQVFRLAFLSNSTAGQMGVPTVPLSQLYSPAALAGTGLAEVRLRAAVERIVIENGSVSGVQSRGERYTADYYIAALPFERLPAVAPELAVPYERLRHSPITGIHLWFDRPVTGLPHAALLDRTVQWFFNKEGGRYLQLVVSASRSLAGMGRAEIIRLARRELAEFLPEAARAELRKAHVIKEVHATFTPSPGLESVRPPAETACRNLFLAGDWTRSGWPSTMEGAVRSGRLAAEAVARTAGRPRRYLIPDCC